MALREETGNKASDQEENLYTLLAFFNLSIKGIARRDLSRAL
ncbi:hypothetical protein NEOC95_001034 [Neochlamydia sp. AcF95]|nr:hypothetical protein [Neochlamydia sp. AcF95]